ncbi:MAG: hypothetical protein V2A54_07490 [Bacteroidota bacterium]
MKKIFLLVLLLFVLRVSAFSQTNGDFLKNDSISSYLNKGFTDIYHYRFVEAEAVIKDFKYFHNKSPWPFLLATNLYWWRFISGEENQTILNQFNNNLKACETRLNTKDYKDNNNLFCLIMVYMYKARVKLLYKEYISTINVVKKNINIVEKSFGRESVYEPFYMTTGLYNCLITAADDYVVMAPFKMFFPDGNKTTGHKYLGKTALSQNICLFTESNYFLMKIWIEIEKRTDMAQKYAETLVKKYPENLLFRFHMYNVAKKNKQAALAASQVESIKKQITSNKQLNDAQRKYWQFAVSKM